MWWARRGILRSAAPSARTCDRMPVVATLPDIVFGAFMVAAALAVAWTVGSAVMAILESCYDDEDA